MRQVALRLQSMDEPKEEKETKKEQVLYKEPFETSPGPFDWRIKLTVLFEILYEFVTHCVFVCTSMYTVIL